MAVRALALLACAAAAPATDELPALRPASSRHPIRFRRIEDRWKARQTTLLPGHCIRRPLVPL